MTRWHHFGIPEQLPPSVKPHWYDDIATQLIRAVLLLACSFWLVSAVLAIRYIARMVFPNA